jgi:glycosyltransferase involved in cell wall biosynthesis
MKVAFFSSRIYESGGGLEKYFIDTAAALTGQQYGQVDIICPSDTLARNLGWPQALLGLSLPKKAKHAESTESINNRLDKSNYFKPDTIKQLSKKLREYDVIYSRNEITEAIVLKFMIGYKNLPPVIFGIHTAHRYPHTNGYMAKLHNILYGSSAYNFLLSGVAGFHVSNKESYELISKQFPTKNIRLIYHPFNIDEFVKQSETWTYAKNWDHEKFNIVWIGRFTEQKGIDDLCRIIQTLNLDSHTHRPLHWTIIGAGGPEENKIINLQKKNSNVELFGYVENIYIPNILANQDLYICTSKWEVGPFTLIEALAMKIPAVAYRIPGPQDFVDDGKTGLLVENVEEFITEVKKLIRSEYKFKDGYESMSKKLNPSRHYDLLAEFLQDMKRTEL